MEFDKSLQNGVETCTWQESEENKGTQETGSSEKLFFRFAKRRPKTSKERGAAYRVPVQSEAIDEDKETSYVSDFTGDHFDCNDDFLQESSKKSRKRRKKLEKKAASFDYADLRNEIDYPSRMSVRRTAICAKSKSTDAIQLETFIVVSRLKQFDLL